jgi:hypothetical protein
MLIRYGLGRQMMSVLSQSTLLVMKSLRAIPLCILSIADVHDEIGEPRSAHAGDRKG